MKNITVLDQAIRLIIGTTLIALTMSGISPVWFALLAPYFVLTAMTSLDPFYAFSRTLFSARRTELSTGYKSASSMAG